MDRLRIVSLVVIALGCGSPPLGLGPFAGARALDLDPDGRVLGDIRDPVTV